LDKMKDDKKDRIIARADDLLNRLDEL